MKSLNSLVVVILLLVVGTHAGSVTGAAGDEKDLAAQLEAAKRRATSVKYLLRYKFTKGEKVRWKVKHLGTTETTIQGNTQTSKSRSISTKVWNVTDVDAEGNITLVHSVSNINMWQKVSRRPEVRYNSETDEKAPPEYLSAAQSVGVPIATVTFSPSGKIVQRDGSAPQTSSGLGEIVMLLPPKPVPVGQTWHASDEILVRRQDGQVKRIKIRLVYKLKSVKSGVATISVKTEILTPVNNPKIKSQLVQQITNGEVKFDVDAGRIISRQIDWDETVVGFNGSDSLMKYLARFTEELLPAEATARKRGADVR